MYLKLIKNFKYRICDLLETEIYRRYNRIGKGRGAACFVVVVVVVVVAKIGLVPSPNFNSLSALHVHVTGLKFSEKKDQRHSEKKNIYSISFPIRMKWRYFVLREII